MSGFRHLMFKGSGKVTVLATTEGGLVPQTAAIVTGLRLWVAKQRQVCERELIRTPHGNYEITHINPGDNPRFTLLLQEPTLAALALLYKGRPGRREGDQNPLTLLALEAAKASKLFQGERIKLRVEGLVSAHNGRKVFIEFHSACFSPKAYFKRQAGMVAWLLISGEAFPDFASPPTPLLGYCGRVEAFSGSGVPSKLYGAASGEKTTTAGETAF